MKTCATCHRKLPLEKFHRNGPNPKRRRPSCKECVSFKTRRKSKVEAYIELPPEFRRKNYVETVHKMVRMGIMSETYARGALARIDSLEL